MYLKCGSHQHAAGECLVDISRQGLRSEHGILYGVRETWRISGMLTGSVAELTTAIAALELAYASDSIDLGLYEDSGTATAHTLHSADTLGGTRVVERPSFHAGVGAEYATFRTYTVVVEGDRNLGAGLLTFAESITFSGGGMDWGYLPVLNGTPPQQIFREQTTFKAVQTGHATHLSQYPIPPSPIWPAAEHRTERQIVRSGPMRVGAGGSLQYINFGTQWTYSFEAASEFAGSPNAWGV